MAALALFGHYNVSITDKTCSWNTKKQPGDNTTKKLCDLYPPPREHRATNRNLREEEIEEFANKSQEFNMAVGFTWLLLKHDDCEVKLLADIEDILFSQEYTSHASKSKYLEDQLKVSEEVILKVANETIGQCKNPKWLIAKKTPFNSEPILFHSISSKKKPLSTKLI